jgi:hypothetical protein
VNGVGLILDGASLVTRLYELMGINFAAFTLLNINEWTAPNTIETFTATLRVAASKIGAGLFLYSYIVLAGLRR